MRIESPSTSRVGTSSRRSATKVPFLLSRSSSVASLRADCDPRMTAGHISRIEEQFQSRVAAKHVLTVGQTGPATRPRQTEAGVLSTALRPPRLKLGRWISERIPKPVDRTDELRMGRVVAEGRPDLGDEIDEILLDDEGPWPELLLKQLTSPAPSAGW